jgi:hypothetical protein
VYTATHSSCTGRGMPTGMCHTGSTCHPLYCLTLWWADAALVTNPGLQRYSAPPRWCTIVHYSATIRRISRADTAPHCFHTLFHRAHNPGFPSNTNVASTKLHNVHRLLVSHRLHKTHLAHWALGTPPHRCYPDAAVLTNPRLGRHISVPDQITTTTSPQMCGVTTRCFIHNTQLPIRMASWLFETLHAIIDEMPETQASHTFECSAHFSMSKTG